MDRLERLGHIIEVLRVHPIGHLIADRDGEMLYLNPALEKMLGYSMDDIPDEDAWFGLLHDDPMERERCRAEYHKGRDGSLGPDDRHYSRLRTRSGVEVGCLFSFSDLGDGLHMVTVESWDEGIVPENELRSSEDRFRLLVEHMTEIVALHEIVYDDGVPVDYIILDCNVAWERMTDTRRGLGIGRLATEVYGTDEAPFLDIYTEVAMKGGSKQFSAYFEPYGKYFDITVISDRDGQFWTVTVDTTEHTQDMRALGESEMRYRLISEVQDNLVARIAPDRRLLFMSPSFQRFFGLDDSDLGTEYCPRVHPDHLEDVRLMHRAARSPPFRASCEAWTFSQDGMRTVQWTIKGVGRGPEHYILLGRDVTEVREAERGLRMHRYSTEKSDDAVLFLYMDGEIAYVNDAGLRLAGHTREEADRMNIYELFQDVDPDFMYEVFTKMVSDGPQRSSVTIPKVDGALELDVTVSPLTMEGMEFLQLHARDVTELVRQRERLNASLEEKTTLLQEVHHRVKNNMATVNSMLMLQMANVDDERVRNALLDAENRIMSMAMVHESVYCSDSLSNIEVGEHVERLGREILGSSPKGSGIDLVVRSVPCLMDLEHAVPVSLIVNELLTNSMKYAFPDGHGTISIDIEKDDDTASIVVSDDGVGMPVGLDVDRTTSLGIRLVRNLVEKQLGGTIRLVDSPGTVWRIDLPRGC